VTHGANRGHVDAVDLLRMLTFAAVIAVHTVTTVNPPDSVPAGGAVMLLHFTREAFTGLFALGVGWTARRAGGPGSRAVEIGSDRSFGVFLVHPMVLWALTLGPLPWLSTQVSALGATVIAIAVTVVGSLLAVEVLRHTPLSLVLTGKRRSLQASPFHSTRPKHFARSDSSASTQPVRLGAGRT